MRHFAAARNGDLRVEEPHTDFFLKGTRVLGPLRLGEKAATLVEKALDFRLLDLHLDRISDIALSPLEVGSDRPLLSRKPIRGEIELRNVCFRYAETERFVLENHCCPVN
jgi:hypothetical protein